MKHRGAYSVIHTVIFAVLLLGIFYMISYFSTYVVPEVRASSLVILFSYFCILFFSLGILLPLVDPFVNLKWLFVHLAVFSLSLGVVVILEFIDTQIFKFLILPLLAFAGVYMFFMFLFFKEKLTPHTIPVSSESETSSHEKRKFPRYRDALLVKCTIKDREVDCITHDVSAAGVRLILHEPLDKGEVMSCVIDISGYTSGIYAKGRVRWCSLADKVDGVDHYHVGVEFTHLDSADKLRLLSRYVYDMFKNHKT